MTMLLVSPARNSSPAKASLGSRIVIAVFRLMGRPDCPKSSRVLGARPILLTVETAFGRPSSGFTGA
ncbi:hypothetical protein ACVIGB_008919 [Bradyrhizobium sp. USDA 4341]